MKVGGQVEDLMFGFQPQPAAPSSLSLGNGPISGIWQWDVSRDGAWGPGPALQEMQNRHSMDGETGGVGRAKTEADQGLPGEKYLREA